MQIVKHSTASADPMPLLAALGFSVILEEGEDKTDESVYDPNSQRTVYSMGHNYSTCREEDSAGSLWASKSDTKKDD